MIIAYPMPTLLFIFSSTSQNGGRGPSKALLKRDNIMSLYPSPFDDVNCHLQKIKLLNACLTSVHPGKAKDNISIV